ncbi:MAG: VOC family protein [Acidimicrobiia bacterium]
MPSLSLNHAVLFVADVNRATAFYTDVLGFSIAADERENGAAFLRAPESSNHHDLGLFQTRAPRPPRGSVGLYHLAWQVAEIDDLVPVKDALSRAGHLTGQSHHGATISLYGADVDGNEFEIMWMLPREEWGEYEDKGVVLPLDLDAEVARWSVKPKP